MRKFLTIIALGAMFGASPAAAGDAYRYFDRGLDTVDRMMAYSRHRYGQHNRFDRDRRFRHQGHTHGPGCGHPGYGAPHIAHQPCGGNRCGNAMPPPRIVQGCVAPPQPASDAIWIETNDPFPGCGKWRVYH